MLVRVYESTASDHLHCRMQQQQQAPNLASSILLAKAGRSTGISRRAGPGGKAVRGVLGSVESGQAGKGSQWQVDAAGLRGHERVGDIG